MPVGVWNLQWLDLNRQRAYPLRGDATGVDETGTFTLPQEFLVGLHLPLDSGLDVDPAAFFLWKLAALGGGFALTFGYDAPGGPQAVARASVPRAGFARNAAFPVVGVGDFHACLGQVLVGDLATIDLQPAGSFTFTPAAAPLDLDAVKPLPLGVSALYVVNGADRVGPLTGDVEFRAGTNFRLSLEGSGPGTVVLFSAVSGEGTLAACECAGDAADLPCVTNVNGVLPVDGGITLAGDACYQITSGDGGLAFADACSAPCCSCPELETITRDLSRLRQQMATTEGFVTSLQATAQQMSLLLGTVLGDRGCVTCG